MGTETNPLTGLSAIPGAVLGTVGGYAALTDLQDQLRALGLQASEGATQIGNQAVTDTQFQPYTVSSNLANVGTTAQGGFNLNLSPQQQAQQQALFGQAQGQFGQVGQGMTRAERDAQNRRFREAESMFGRARGDTGELASEYYENIRAAQRPEEERQRMALDQGLFSSGRGGISTAEFGGTAEEFAFEKARAEAGLQASAMARQAALGEQAQALSAGQSLFNQAYAGQQAAQSRDTQALALGTGLFGQGYVPQQEAINLFGASNIPSQLSSQGQLSGAELRAQLEQAGLEGMLSAGTTEAQVSGNIYNAILNSLVGGVNSAMTK